MSTFGGLRKQTAAPKDPRLASLRPKPFPRGPGRSAASAPSTASSDSSSQAIAAKLRKLLKTSCPEYEDKYMILKQRDDLLSKARPQNYNVHASTAVKGTLLDMCPEKERYSRMMQKSVNSYECDSGDYNPDKFVKDYARSAADQELPLPHELRPVNTLELTMDYLISEIANFMPDQSAQGELVKWYEFLWTRTRAVRKDITQQGLVNTTVVDLIEKCARFHVLAGYQLAPLGAAFDQRMNIENLAKCLQSLRHCYDDLTKQNIFCPNEAEFRSYDVLLNVCDSNVFNQSCKYRQEIQDHPLVLHSLELALAYHNGNIVRFFRLVASEKTTFLQACLCYNNFKDFRHLLVTQISNTFTRENALQLMSEYLVMDDQKECMEYLLACGATAKESRPEHVILLTKGMSGKPDIPDAPSSIVYNKLNVSIAELLCNGIPRRVRIPRATNSFDQNDCYVGDEIVLNFIKEHGENISTANAFPPSSSSTLGKVLFQPGYSDDPLEPVPVIRFPKMANKPATDGASSTFSTPFQFGGKTSGAKSLFNQAIGDAIGGAKKSFLDVVQKSSFNQLQPPTNGSLSVTFPRASSPPPAKLPPTSSIAPPPVVPSISIPVPSPEPTPEPPKPSGPTPEELEAERKRIAAEKARKETEKKAYLKKLRDTVAPQLLDQCCRLAMDQILSVTAETAVRKIKERDRYRRKLVKSSSKVLLEHMVMHRLDAIAEKVVNENQKRWARCKQIQSTIHFHRVQLRLKRYTAIWRWFTRRQREIRALETFGETLGKRSNDIIAGLASKMAFQPLKPVNERDNLRLGVLAIQLHRDERLGRKYLEKWRNFVKAKKAKRENEERRYKTLSPRSYIPSLLQSKMLQIQQMSTGTQPVLTFRKRPSDSSIIARTPKRYMTSTPVRSFFQQRCLPDISPIPNAQELNGLCGAEDTSDLARLQSSIDKANDVLQKMKQDAEKLRLRLRREETVNGGSDLS